MPFHVGKVGQVAASRHPILVEDVAAQNDWILRPTWAKREEIRSFAGHPLIFRDKLLGVIAVFSRQPFGRQEFTWLGLFANQAAVAIANACAEEALQSTQRNLAAIINTIPTTAWTSRPDGYCDFLNQVWLDYAGLSAEQAQGWGWAEAIHPEDRKGLVEEWQSCLASGTPVDTEARIRRFDGSHRWFLIRANPLRSESGDILKWYGTCTDIEDRKQTEEALSRARSELAHVARVTTMGELTASIAHEVQQPISAAVTSAQTALRCLESQPPELVEVRKALSRIELAGKRAGEVVRQIRALVTKAPPPKEFVDINSAIREVVQLTRGEAARSGIPVRMELSDDLPPILGDRVQLQQVILNLIVNGIEAIIAAGERSGKLTVASGRDDAGDVRVAVADTGRGLAADAREQIFAAFYTTKPSGLGLGLSICRSIIEAHDGRLWVSANEPRGAVFQLTLPAKRT